MLSNDIDEARARRRAVHAADERGGRDHRRPDRLPRSTTHRYLLVVNASNREADFDWLDGARAARLRRARRLRRVRAARRAGAARARAARPRARRRRSPSSMGELDGVEVMVNRTGYTGEEGVELALHGRRRGRALGRDPRARRRRRAGSARATRCGSRSATRCTATTSARSGTRSRRASAGRARSTRTSPAPSACARSRSAGPERKLVAVP